MGQIPISFKITVSLISLLAVTFLFFFGEGFIAEDVNTTVVNGESDIASDSFVFKPEELSYDGKGKLDLLEGVSLEHYSPEELKKMVYIRITTGENLSQKIVEYQADTDTGRVKSKRILRLRNYKGPKIQLPDEMPLVTMDTIDHMSELIKSQNKYYVDDGFGNDARDYVQVDSERSMQNSSLVSYSFVLENEFGDRVVAKSDIILSDVPATIILTDSVVYLQIDEYFNPLQYVESATDSDGHSIIEEVDCEGEIDTSISGEYEVIYSVREQTAILTVCVNNN